MYRCLEGGIVAILQAYVDEDVRISKFMLKINMLILCVDLAKLTYHKNNQAL